MEFFTCDNEDFRTGKSTDEISNASHTTGVSNQEYTMIYREEAHQLNDRSNQREKNGLNG